jgi:membrane-associated phospholipid phosphatase
MPLSMLRSAYWDNLTKSSSEFWIYVVRIHEVLAFFLMLVVMAPLLPLLDFGAKMSIPSVQNATFHTIGMNPLYSHPIKLNSHLCWPADLNACLLQGSSSNGPCCTELYDKDAIVEMSVTDVELVVIVVLIAVAYLVLRCWLWQAYTTHCQKEAGQQLHEKSINVDKRFWRKVLWDSLLALVICQIITYIITDYVKEAVGAPRPIYYALKLFTSVYNSDRSVLEGMYFLASRRYCSCVLKVTHCIDHCSIAFVDNAQLSFPSGHASMSLSGLGLPSLFCFMDSLKFRSKYPIISLLLIFVSLTPLVVAFYIGITRVSDMWHFAWDVLGK